MENNVWKGLSNLNHCWEANQGTQPLWNTSVSNLSRRQAGPSRWVHKARQQQQQQNQTNDRTTRFRKCPTMCILFHIIIQCLHSYNSRENAFSLPITYVVPRSLTLTWRIGGGGRTALSPLPTELEGTTSMSAGKEWESYKTSVAFKPLAVRNTGTWNPYPLAVLLKTKIN